MNIFSACCNPLTRCLRPGDSTHEEDQGSLLWHKGLTQCTTGDFSIAVVQANEVLEDQSQVKIGHYGTLIGIYDGHGGTEASRFVANCLFPKIEGFAQDVGGMSLKVLKRAISAVEEEFSSIVEKNWASEPKIASVGTCCIVGAISGNHLYVANLGDSRVVLGTQNQGKIVASRISDEHNAGNEEVRKELKEQHPDDSQIVLLKHGVWRVKGIIQVSRSIGDVYLKKPQLNKDLCFSHGGVAISFKKSVLSAEPSLHEKVLTVEDRFLIFASDGLWEQVTDQEAVEIVHKGSRDGIAKRLVRAALQQVAKKREMRYSDLKKVEPGVRRHFHDDISVVVVFLDHNMMGIQTSTKCRACKISMDSVNAPINIFSPERLQNMHLKSQRTNPVALF